ncbi:MAG: alkaline phosphatase D family protein [Stagnimonas sp.]|nr:alkaline phosphatase D family protein [Stagnimonas sp.]
MSGPRRLRSRLRIGRPSRFSGFSRRDFLKRIGSAAGLAVAAPLLSSCGDSPLADAGSATPPPGSGATVSPFKHGVASGDPLPNAVILWTRATPVATEAIPVTVKVYRDTALTQLVGSVSQMATSARDWTIKIDFTGLATATTYYFQFEALGFKSVIGRTKTAPAAGAAVSRMRFGVVSCSSLAHGFFNAYRKLAERADLDVILHLGDYIYEYGTGEYGTARAYEPANEITTLADYRARHNQYKRTDTDLQEVHRQTPFITIWDDHETTDNSYTEGANNHTEGVEGVWTERKGFGQRAYDEWMPIRLPTPGDANKIWRNFGYGNLIEFVMLDTRLYDRTLQLGTPPLPPDNPADPTRTLIGPEQKQFLFDRLSSTTATWKFIGQQVMFGQLKVVGLPDLGQLPVLGSPLSLIPIAGQGGQYLNSDQWDGYQAERSDIFNYLSANSITNTVVLTGDIHTSWAMDLSPDPNNLLTYNPLTGAGSLGVEYVCTSVTSPGLDQLAPVQDALRINNPHMKYIDLAQKGYMVFDVTPERTVGEWWYVSTIAEQGGTESFGTAFPVNAGDNHLGAALAEPTAALATAPALAP